MKFKYYSRYIHVLCHGFYYIAKSSGSGHTQRGSNQIDKSISPKQVEKERS
jgi:hypothetical protein